MARIDKLLQAVQSYRADALIMTSGEKVILALGSERRSVKQLSLAFVTLVHQSLCLHENYERVRLH